MVDFLVQVALLGSSFDGFDSRARLHGGAIAPGGKLMRFLLTWQKSSFRLFLLLLGIATVASTSSVLSTAQGASSPRSPGVPKIRCDEVLAEWGDLI